MQKKNIVQIQIQINNVKDKRTISESIKKSIQNEVIKDILFNLQ